jgi:hypothetical protein
LFTLPVTQKNRVKQLIVVANPVVATLLCLFKGIIFVPVEAMQCVSYFPEKIKLYKGFNGSRLPILAKMLQVCWGICFCP